MELQPNCDLTPLINFKGYGLKSIKCKEPVMGFCLIAVSGNWYEELRLLPVMGFLYTTENTSLLSNNFKADQAKL